MKSQITAASLLLALLIVSLLISCRKEVCRTCIRCISYESDFTIANEVKECHQDTVYLTNFSKGFMEGANSVGRDAICFNLGIECVCE